MEVQEYLKYRIDLLNESQDEEGFIQQSQLLSQVLPLILDAKLIDSEDWNETYYIYNIDNLKLNGYIINELGERLQLFIVDESTIDVNSKENELMISTKAYYDNQFKRVTKFINKAIKGYLNDEVQDADPIRPLISLISSGIGIDQFDVIEVFLISATATVETRGTSPQPKRIDFEDENTTLSYTINNNVKKKEIIIKRKLIDLNFLYNVFLIQGSRLPLKINFAVDYNYKIEVIKAAGEKKFESYLCVLPARILAALYKDHSSRLLEKNVRSFLLFKGKNNANKGIRETIRICPEKFIAFNNGITITSTDKEIEVIDGKTYITSLTDFQIVNGGQTTATIYFTNKDGYSIEKVKVMAKINVALDVTEDGLDELISDISKYSNSQTKVSSVDFGSRNPQINKIKAISESVITPSGRKWFFEKSRGDFNTKSRISSSNKARLEKDYPKKFRFSKEQLGKYYTAWGDVPYVVKKGGDKVFGYFIDAISNNESGNGATNIDRNFYESLISKIILFNELENLYGQGKKSIGNLRSAVIPYSLSVFYCFTSKRDDGRKFDLNRIWIKEGLEKDLARYFTDLMTLMNDLIKTKSGSDDYGEFSKKKELWDNISTSNEIKLFFESENSKKILDKYTISKEELIKRNLKYAKSNLVDFKLLNDNISITANGSNFYNTLENLYSDKLSESECSKLDSIISSIIHKSEIDQKHIDFEKELIHKIRKNNPEIFDQINVDSDQLLIQSLDFIIKNYNNALDFQNDIPETFNKIQCQALLKKKKNASVFGQIGKILQAGKSPSVKQIHEASFYLRDDDDVDQTIINKDLENREIKIDIELLKDMFEWDSKHKIVSNQESTYLYDLAFGLKDLSTFHENIVRKHLKTLVKAGYNLKKE